MVFSIVALHHLRTNSYYTITGKKMNKINSIVHELQFKILITTHLHELQQRTNIKKEMVISVTFLVSL